MSPTRLEVHFDYRSPFAFMASKLLPPLAERHGAELAWTPIDLLGLSNFSGGMPYSDKKRAYVFVDAARSAQFHAIEIRPPKPFPIESDLVLRVALVAQELGNFDSLHDLLFRATWRDQLDVSSDAILAECIEAAGGEPGDWLQRAHSAELTQRLAAATAASDALGIFGVPTVVVDGELFWGIDSFPTLDWRLAQLRTTGE